MNNTKNNTTNERGVCGRARITKTNQTIKNFQTMEFNEKNNTMPDTLQGVATTAKNGAQCHENDNNVPTATADTKSRQTANVAAYGEPFILTRNGRTLYGVIDRDLPNGRSTFVYCDGDTWGSLVIYEERHAPMKRPTTAEDRRRAFDSAREYCRRERASVNAYLATLARDGRTDAVAVAILDDIKDLAEYISHEIKAVAAA